MTEHNAGELRFFGKYLTSEELGKHGPVIKQERKTGEVDEMCVC